METKDYIEIAALILSVGGILIGLGKMAGSLSETSKFFGKEMKSMKEEMTEFSRAVTAELTKVNDILVRLATVNGRIDRVEDRQLSEGKRIDEMSKMMLHKLLGDK